MGDFVPSEYQKKIFEFVEQGIGNAVVNAKAGSAKTTTAIKALDYIPDDKKVLFIAFNKAIAEEIQKKTTNLKNVKVRTFHSLGLAILTENIGQKELAKYKYTSYIISNIEELSGGIYSALSDVEKNNYKENCIQLVDLARYNNCQTTDEIRKMVEKYGLAIEGTEPEVVFDVLEWGKTYTDKIDFLDMEWLPCELGFGTKRSKYDWIIIDEAQDSSPIQQKLVKKCFKRNTRFMAIGDKCQCINAWAGADLEAFENFEKEPNTETYDLPVSFRCSKAVIKKAQELVPDIIAYENALEGGVYTENISPYHAQNGDMVLCRNTVPLVQLYMDYLKYNIKAFIKGSDLGENLNKMVDSTKKTELNASMLSDGVLPVLWKFVLTTLSKTMKKHNLDASHAIATEEFMSVYDSVKTIEILSKGLATSAQLKDRINRIFLKDDGDGVCLSTVHKAKGLEAVNVYILCPSLMPSSKATLPWEIEAERNIQYVAITRAKKNLYYVSEKIFPPERGYANASSVLEDIKNISDQLLKLYHKNFLTDTGLTTSTYTPTQRSFKPTPQKPKKVGANKFRNFMK